MPLSRFLAVVFSVLLLVACRFPVTNDSRQDSGSYRLNPAPKKAYRIRMVIEDAPGAFLWKRALVQYDVTNRECLRPPKDNPGGRSSPVPTEDIEVPLTQISENEYEALIYADYMLDEDYVGRGVCHWELIQFRVHMKATGAHEETLFIPSISEGTGAKISGLQTEVVYFNKRSYPRADMENFPNTGRPRHRFADWVRDEDLFRITFIPTLEAQP